MRQNLLSYIFCLFVCLANFTTLTNNANGMSLSMLWRAVELKVLLCGKWVFVYAHVKLYSLINRSRVFIKLFFFFFFF